MLKGIVLFILSLLSCFTLISQSCLSNGILFDSQKAIDSFPLQYPGCHSIEGYVTIQGSEIANLDSLYAITAVQGDLTIQNTGQLISLQGLHNLSIMGGSLNLLENQKLSDLSSLSLLDTIDGDLYIHHNSQLHELTGFESLKQIKGQLRISVNPELLSLDKFTQLKSVVGLIIIVSNQSLKHLYGFEGITFQLDNIKILNNDSLLDYHGFDNLTILRGGLTLDNNPMVLDFSGFAGLKESGDLIIDKTTCKNLTGFNQLTRVRGTLEIGLNPNLETLDGLPGLHQVEAWLNIAKNGKLINLQGLESLEAIGGLILDRNDSLASALGLNNLKSIEFAVRILNNPQLQDLSPLIGASGQVDRLIISENEILENLNGLDHLCNSPILELTIDDNPNLSICNNACICAHLLQGGSNTISGNKNGCNTRDEIVTACLVKATDPERANKIVIYPNPAFDQVEIKGLTSFPFQYSIHNATGQLVSEGLSDQAKLDINHLSSGVYLLMINVDNKISSHRIIKI